ncbi:hypothetical protein FD967_10525 [Polynucleobacter sp. JS-Mosq-20-D10]|uniref:hypothetical protein n=1 Tax=Polynucleobacter sp. JS-Mosq-20-D10 TaxID=2576922 RepID=UPI001BFCECFC|nr:hypothetical protein [Polynucleobacter sp. JS-Mosq-20-D10]QWE00443.1 hypothetical protein FD967_10525 [Polynucleobacter sp. JS-Mosq-20-D10]
MKNITIRNCTFAFRCKANWDAMTQTDTEGKVRFCLDCQKEVFLCENDEELISNVVNNRCIALIREERGQSRRLLGEVINRG